ncbi:NAD-dependent epimerase/dehydratase [Butyrivibrio proteoclasticus B316]|uniref:NAD-dependent epimerase/dehydratase n=1 Tax=Butyrivibrio proteoclasticus (strain ATCC 51982 / DSM 14932 / B316) TaxID=515622 RepID=E0S231_BUTPB|nr:NAD(P)-dependent oxidoreductase [Butyrivibrio proteoclasticus]ADL33856.1 NAD-dependent epimerase/dehydratase [Butyrivibrio proteoclasticus B316]
MKTAIVSGATGFIGVHLCYELVSNNVEVYALVRKNSINAERLPDNVHIIECGMDDYSSLSGIQADIFFHLAWEGATGPKRDDEIIQSKNVVRTLAALSTAKRLGCERFVALGTVYEKLAEQILSETYHRKADFYLLSKLSAHQMCYKLAQKLDIEFVWATIFQPIGKYIKKEQVIAYTIDCLIKGIKPEYGPALEPYDITAVEDIVRGLRLIGEGILKQSEYYIGSGKPMILKAYLEKIRKIIETDTDLDIGSKADDGLRFSFDWYNIEPLKTDTGFEPKVEFEQAVINVINWLKTGEHI